jgi:aspartate kinase
MEAGTQMTGSSVRPTPQCVVMKFGGTSLEDAAAIRRAGALVKSRLREHPVVVVSAMAKVTDQLLTAAQAAAENALLRATETLQQLCERHQRVARELVAGESGDQLCHGLRAEFDLIHELVTRVQADGMLGPKIQDRLLGIGETLSSKIMQAWLRQTGVDAAWVDAKECIITDAAHTRATPIWGETNQRTEARLLPLLHNRRVPVLGGFVGATPDGVPTTLGRGGSDFSAAIVARALHAHRIEIWTDVDGVMTTDPDLCADARCLPRMSFDEAADLAHFGAKVLHPSTLVPAMANKIPVRVLNSRNPEREGTEILSQTAVAGEVKAITSKDVAVVNFESASGFRLPSLVEVFAAFERHQQSFDLISASPGSLALIVNRTAALSAIAEELKEALSVRWENHKALVSLIGEQIRCRPEIGSQALHAMAGLDARMICLGVSERNISFLTNGSQAGEAVQRLHTCFFSSPGKIAGARREKDVAFHALCQASSSWR